ncbi:MAG: ABC transporter permease, partial [Oscillospiraceae bacterium]|nr:ABC transporter permease [Oscillospiraceae bacterium]
AIFSVFSAMAVWSFLYSSRSASGMACLPVRREEQFFSALLAGFLPLAASNLITVLLTLPFCLMADVSPVVLLEFLCITVLILLFFYGFATLCAQLTGNILILPAVYGILNFVVVAVDFLLRLVLSWFVYGMYRNPEVSDLACYLSPAVGMFGGTDVDTVYGYATGAAVPQRVDFLGWGLLGIYAGVGILCVAAALLLFRRRKMESAGDVVAVDFLRPVFRWCMALGCGLCLSCIMQAILYWDQDSDSAFSSLLIFFLLGAFIGWFASEMLMKKTFRVFGKRTWAGFGICCAVILVLMLGMRFDLFGYEKRVPRAEQVESVSLSCNGESAVLAEPENIDRAIALHRAILADKALNQNGTYARMNFRLTYELKNGLSMDRCYQLAYWYDLDEQGELNMVQDLLNSPEATANRKQMEVPVTRENIVYASVSALMTVPECARAAGFNDPEDYLLAAYAGYSTAELPRLDPEKRRERIEEVLNDFAESGWDYGAEYTGSRDLEGVFITYNLSLTDTEAEAFYRDCILPDIEDGALGRVWLVSDADYYAQVYSAMISISCEEQQQNSKSGYRRSAAADFYTHPLITSRRTNAWLAKKGIVLHTEGEICLGEPGEKRKPVLSAAVPLMVETSQPG